MRLLSLLPVLAGLLPVVLAEDLLFLDTLLGEEYNQALALGFTIKTVNEATWRAMTTAEFASYKAIVFADQFCQTSIPPVIEETQAVWAPAVLGHVVVIGEFPSDTRQDDRLTLAHRY
jgi:hypothetical protein